jgi:hypothetical protein
MNRPQVRVAAIGLLGLGAMALYVPYRDVERVYTVVPVQQPGGAVVSMGRTDELREVKTLAAGYGWVWALPHSDRVAWFGTERETSIHWNRLLAQVAVWALLVGAGLVLLRAQAWPSR